MGRRAGRLPVLIVGGTLAVLLATAAAGFAPAVRARVGWTASDRPAYTVGDVIDIPTGLLGRNERTLVVFASGTCGACVRSRPALSALSAELPESSTAFLLVTPGTMKVDQESLVAALGLNESEHASLDLSGLRVRSVPTVVLVAKSGRVLFSAEGVLDQARQDAILRAVRGGGPS